MRLDTYLFFDGNCREAFEFYAQCLGGTVTAMSTYGEGPAKEHTDVAYHGHIMHGCVEFGEHRVMGTDSTPGHPYRGIVGAHLVVSVDEPDRARELFELLSKDGEIEMPIDQTFWARAFGIAIDRFGVPWMINCE